MRPPRCRCLGRRPQGPPHLPVFFSALILSSLELSDTKVYEPSIRACPGTTSHLYICQYHQILRSYATTGLNLCQERCSRWMQGRLCTGKLVIEEMRKWTGKDQGGASAVRILVARVFKAKFHCMHTDTYIYIYIYVYIYIYIYIYI